MSNPNETQKPAVDKKESAGKRRILFVVLGALVIGGALYWTFKPKVETTDNAQVRGHIRPLAPRVAGHILRAIRARTLRVRAHATQCIRVTDVGDTIAKLIAPRVDPTTWPPGSVFPFRLSGQPRAALVLAETACFTPSH